MMFTRIVKMEFEPAQVDSFLNNFELIKDKIRAFPGCLFLELYRDRLDDSIFFTYSKWKHENDLEKYRTSDLFKESLGNNKPKFRSRAEAWSVDTLYRLDF